MAAVPVLLVCSHADTADLYRSALEHAGVGAAATPTPDDAITLLRDKPAAAVVVVIGPGDDPIAIGRMFREQPGSAAATLLALSSVQHDKETLRQALQLFDDALLIPCTPDVLLARLTDISEQKNRRDMT